MSILHLNNSYIKLQNILKEYIHKINNRWKMLLLLTDDTISRSGYANFNSTDDIKEENKDKE